MTQDYTKPPPVNSRPIAVAIQGEDGNPESRAKITAAGRGKVAEQILALAFERGIRVLEDADLAQLLAQLKLDTPIPSEAIVAVAEILAKVYDANNRLASSVPSSLHEPHDDAS